MHINILYSSVVDIYNIYTYSIILLPDYLTGGSLRLFHSFYSWTRIIVQGTLKMYTMYICHIIGNPGPKNCNNSKTKSIINVTRLFNKNP